MGVAQIVLLLMLALLRAAQTKTYQRLQAGIQLTKGDELISTLGLYKLIMNDADCSLNFYKFDQSASSYMAMNQKLTPNGTSNCQYFQIIDRSIVTNTSTFLDLSVSNLSRAYLIIDDTAVVRFIGYKNPSNMPADYVQIAINNYSQPSPTVSILDSHTKISDNLNATTNANKWSFQVNAQTLTITNTASLFSQSFTLPTVFFDTNGIYDNNNETTPGAIFSGLNLGSVCGGEKGQLYGPFVMEVNNYWPTLTIYDQERYKVFEYSILQNDQTSNPCPKFTFALKDQCYISCPNPYFHQIQDSWGRCVLNCEGGSTLDPTARTCTCPNRPHSIPASYNCINGSLPYIFGCYCQNGTFFDKNSHRCTANCSNQTVPYLGMCLPCGRGCQQCSLSFNGLYYLTCTQCNPGYTLTNGVCVYSTACTANCLTCDQKSVCTSCLPFYVLSNGTCLASCATGSAVLMQNLTSSCSAQGQANQCGPECLKCVNITNCIVCQPGYALLVSPLSVTCRKKNLLYSCQPQGYSPSIGSNVCYSNDSNSLAKLSCVNPILSCLLCHPTLANVCLLCISGQLLQQNTCVSKCNSNYFAVNQACISAIPQCQITSFISGKYNQTLTQDTLSSNSFYLNFIRNGNQATNQPYGFELYFAAEFMFKTDANTVDGKVEWMQQICSQCQQGFGLTSDHSSCIPCPTGCLLCLYATTCLATTKQEVFALTLGNAINSCQSFLSEDYSCVNSCPVGKNPTMNATFGKIMCGSAGVDSSATGYLRVDGSTYVISDSQYIHRFIFDSPIKPSSLRLLQKTTSNLSIDANGYSITFSSKSPTQILNLTGELTNINSANGQYPANTVYGINYETSFRSYIKKWLAGIGYVLSIFLILLHCIYVANGIMYKMDNIIIFAQSLFFFLFTQTLIANPVAQFYYGWSWTHLNFFPNYFTPDLDLSEPTIPPYALYNLDGNIIRNAGSTLSFLLTFFMAWGVVSAVLYVLDTYYGRKQIWYEKISKNALISVVQFFSYNIFYWCMTFINHDKNYTNSGTFIGLSVLLLTILIIYLLCRIYFNLMAGIYMIKRLVYACVLASSFEAVGYVGVMIVLEAGFGVARSLIERPRQKWLLVGLWIEQGMLIIFWIILYATTNAAVVSILTTFFLYGWMLTFVADLADLYLHSRNRQLEISCFRKLFEERGEVLGSNESIQREQEKQKEKVNDKEGTERPFSINAANQQQH